MLPPAYAIPVSAATTTEAFCGSPTIHCFVPVESSFTRHWGSAWYWAGKDPQGQLPRHVW